MREQYLAILDLTSDANINQVKKAYRKKARLYHPDSKESEASAKQFIEITEAYNYLLNEFNERFPIINVEEFVKVDYKSFKKSEAYDSTFTSIEILLNYSSFLIGIALALAIPIVGYNYHGVVGLGIATFGLFISASGWVPLLFQVKLVKINLLFSAIRSLILLLEFWVFLFLIVSMVIFAAIGLNTLINTYILFFIYLLLVSLGFLFLFIHKELKLKKVAQPIIWMFLLLTNLFLVLNYFISKNETTEIYKVIPIMEWQGGGRGQGQSRLERTTSFKLPNDKYEEYLGIRMFYDYERVQKTTKVRYHLHEGLFGIRVVKRYEFE